VANIDFFTVWHAVKYELPVWTPNSTKVLGFIFSIKNAKKGVCPIQAYGWDIFLG
jgi:hypothetical protein